MRNVTKAVIAIVAVTSLSGCHIMASTPSGIREFYRGNNGLIVTGKADANKPDEYHNTQKHQETNKTIRKHGAGYFERMMEAMQNAQGGES